MRPLDIAAALNGAEPIEGVLVEYRPHLFSEEARYFVVPAGRPIAAMVGELVAAGHVPAPFAALGAAYVNGTIVTADRWHMVKPKPDTVLFLSIVPQDGDNMFLQIAGLAVAVLAIAVSGGALAAFAPAIFGTAAGGLGAFLGSGIGAQLLGLGIGVAGSVIVNSLSKPPQLGGGGGGGQQLGVAGVGQNPLGAYQPIPIVRGRLRVTPPLLARPWSEIEDSNQVVNAIAGVRGPCAISGTLLDKVALADVPGVEVEHRQGFAGDARLTLVTTCGAEETQPVELRKQDLQDDQETLVTMTADSFPLAHVVRREPKSPQFRGVLHFAAGLYDTEGDDQTAVLPVRIRIKADGGSWVNLPELAFKAKNRAPFRRQLLIDWTGTPGPSTTANTILAAAYASNSSWTAHAYFNGGTPPTGIDTTVTNLYRTADTILIVLDPAQFDPDAGYTIEFMRGYAVAGGQFNTSTYRVGGGSTDPGFFSYYQISGGRRTIPVQDRYVSTLYLESYASLRPTYPIEQEGLCLSAFRVSNRKVSSFSQIYESIVPIWNGTDWNTLAESRNPAALALDILRNPDNYVAPRKPGKIDWESWQAYYEYCEAKGLTFDGLLSDGAVEDHVRAILNAGDASLRRDGQVSGVVIDRDRSADPITCLFTPAVMVRPLTLERTDTPFTTATFATFNDEANDYEPREIMVDDGYMQNGRFNFETVEVPGLTSEAKVRRWCKIYLRRLRYRRVKYSFGVDLDHLLVKRGDLVGVAHDMLTSCYGTGRVVSWTASGGNLTSLTLDNDLLDAPPDNYESLFDVDDVFTLSEFFTLARGAFGARIRLNDGFTTVVPIASVDGKTMTVDGAFAVPNGLEKTCIAALGPRGREVHRIVIGDIGRENERQALITGFREVSKPIFEGL